MRFGVVILFLGFLAAARSDAGPEESTALSKGFEAARTSATDVAAVFCLMLGDAGDSPRDAAALKRANFRYAQRMLTISKTEVAAQYWLEHLRALGTPPEK